MLPNLPVRGSDVGKAIVIGWGNQLTQRPVPETLLGRKDTSETLAPGWGLATNPRPHGYKKLKGRTGFRIRVADYRIIYNIEDNILTVFVLSIGHRKDIYE